MRHPIDARFILCSLFLKGILWQTLFAAPSTCLIIIQIKRFSEKFIRNLTATLRACLVDSRNYIQKPTLDVLDCTVKI